MKRSRQVAFLLTLLLLPLALLRLGQPTGTEASTVLPPGERVVRIEASQYAFRPGTVQVEAGERVTLELVATDVVHGLYLDGYGLEMTAEPGQTARITFTADRSGTFRFRCSVTCGAMHPFMIGKLQVGSNWLLWGGLALAFVGAIAGIAGKWGRA